MVSMQHMAVVRPSQPRQAQTIVGKCKLFCVFLKVAPKCRTGCVFLFFFEFFVVFIL